MMNGHDELGRARAALLALDAGCSRDEWVRAGMAAKAAGLSEDDFLEWSATGDNYGGVREARSVWKSITADRLTCDPKRRTERAREAITGLVTRGVYGAKEGWLWRI